jgi:hypothetical protein
MNTAKVINLLCEAISACNDHIQLINGMELVDNTILHLEIEDSIYSRGYTSTNAVIGSSLEFVRELWKELPESLQDEDMNEIVRKLYHHIYKDDFTKMAEPINTLHTYIYDMWREMDAAKSKFDLTS